MFFIKREDFIYQLSSRDQMFRFVKLLSLSIYSMTVV